jgi:hypothetical protein
MCDDAVRTWQPARSKSSHVGTAGAPAAAAARPASRNQLDRVRILCRANHISNVAWRERECETELVKRDSYYNSSCT